MIDLPMSSVKEQLLALGQRLSTLAQEHELDEAWSIRAELIGIACSRDIAALREQPEARGVVDDEEIEDEYLSLLDWLFKERGYSNDDPVYSMFSAFVPKLQTLTAAQQPVQEGESVEAWSLRMAQKEQGQHVSAGAHGIEDTPAPPSAPVGVEAAKRPHCFSDYGDNHRCKTCGSTDKTGECVTQQPAQAAPGDVWRCGFCLRNYTIGNYCCDEQRAYRATPPGDDAAGGGHG